MFLGTQGDLFTGVNYNGYSSPPGFNFNAGRENRIKVSAVLIFARFTTVSVWNLNLFSNRT